MPINSLEEKRPGHASLASDIVLGNIVALPHKKIDDEYAKKLLKYKDIIEVDYTAYIKFIAICICKFYTKFLL